MVDDRLCFVGNALVMASAALKVIRILGENHRFVVVVALVLPGLAVLVFEKASVPDVHVLFLIMLSCFLHLLRQLFDQEIPS